jgi:hypothetical protein
MRRVRNSPGNNKLSEVGWEKVIGLRNETEESGLCPIEAGGQRIVFGSGSVQAIRDWNGADESNPVS